MNISIVQGLAGTVRLESVASIAVCDYACLFGAFPLSER